MLLYGWGARVGDNWPLRRSASTGRHDPRRCQPVMPCSTARPRSIPARPGTTDLTEHILAGDAYHLNVMPLDAHLPDARALVRATDIAVPDKDGPAK